MMALRANLPAYKQRESLLLAISNNQVCFELKYFFHQAHLLGTDQLVTSRCLLSQERQAVERLHNFHSIYWSQKLKLVEEDPVVLFVHNHGGSLLWQFQKE